MLVEFEDRVSLGDQINKQHSVKCPQAILLLLE